MKIAYHADDAIDAKLISDILNAGGVYAQVRGTHMQSAVGEAAAMGNVTVWVNDEDLMQAQSIIEDWDNAAYAIEDAELFAEDELDNTIDGTEQSQTGSTVLGASFFLIIVLLVISAFFKI